MEIDVGADYLNKLGTAKALEHIARADGEAQNANERAMLESRRAADAKEDALQAKQEVFSVQHQLAVAGNNLREVKLELVRAQAKIKEYEALPQPMLDMIQLFLNDVAQKEKSRESVKAWVKSQKGLQEVAMSQGAQLGLSEDQVAAKVKEAKEKFENDALRIAENIVPILSTNSR